MSRNDSIEDLLLSLNGDGEEKGESLKRFLKLISTDKKGQLPDDLDMLSEMRKISLLNEIAKEQKRRKGNTKWLPKLPPIPGITAHSPQKKGKKKKKSRTR